MAHIAMDKREALEVLARELYWKLERLDPSEDREGPIDWDLLTKNEQEIYVLAMSWVLAQTDVIKTAMFDGLE